MMSACIHCDQEVITAYYHKGHDQDAGPFCCQGCLTVYNIINFKGLSEYYDIKKNVALLKKRAPVELKNNHYSYLNDTEFLNEYAYRNLNNELTMEFYLEGIHCLACLWIIEKLPAFVPGVLSAKLNMGRSVATISIDSTGDFSLVAKELDGIGYRPHPLKINQSTADLKIKEERSMILKIGIAAAAAGNIMLYAVSLYAGAGPEYEQVFNALTVLFAIPVLTYCAFPFYKNSYIALKNKTLSIDVPISLSLIMGGIMGIYNLINHVPENYFDSLTALVFLLLLSRYFLKLIQEKGLSTSDLHFFYQGESVLKVNENNHSEVVEIHPKFIKPNDLLKILPNQVIPADGKVISGESYLNNSLLTGESGLQKIKAQDQVFSGTMNVSGELIIEVEKANHESRLGKILKNVETGWGQKAQIIDITNQISKYFAGAVLTLSVILYFVTARHGSQKEALELALTLLIVTCPCALAIATPLTFIRTLSKAAQKGIIIKDDAVIEKLSRAQKIFIDKTGTITQNQLQVMQMNIINQTALPVFDIIHNLERTSLHPVAICLKEFVKSSLPRVYDVSDLKEMPGVGVSGHINGHFYEIKNYGIYEDHVLVAEFKIQDALRPDALASLNALRNEGLKLQILSGDKTEHVKEIALKLGLTKDEYQAELSPEKKSQIIKSTPNSIMVGDGANDAIALASAGTGIAVFGAMDISLRAADVYMNYPGLSSVAELMVISKETMKVIYRNLVLSISYNSVSVFLAYTGHISPLAAAIIMPLSSLTVLISTLAGTKTLRKLWK